MEIISKDKQERITKCKCCNTQISYKLEDCFLIYGIKEHFVVLFVMNG